MGSAAVQLAAAVGARPLGVASQRNRDYLRALGASEVFDYHAGDWVQQVRAAVPGGVMICALRLSRPCFIVVRPGRPRSSTQTR